MHEERETGVSEHAGFPNPATDTSMPALDFNKLLIAHRASTYMFRVQGNDWQDAGIHDGDIAVIDRALDARNGDVVLWWSDSQGEFAIGKKSAMPPSSAIWGVVTATIHQFRKTSPKDAHRGHV